jgi:Initiation factor 2 subunit family
MQSVSLQGIVLDRCFSLIKPSGVVVGADRVARNGDTANKVGLKFNRKISTPQICPWIDWHL